MFWGQPCVWRIDEAMSICISRRSDRACNILLPGLRICQHWCFGCMYGKALCKGISAILERIGKSDSDVSKSKHKLFDSHPWPTSKCHCLPGLKLPKSVGAESQRHAQDHWSRSLLSVNPSLLLWESHHQAWLAPGYAGLMRSEVTRWSWLLVFPMRLKWSHRRRTDGSTNQPKTILPVHTVQVRRGAVFGCIWIFLMFPNPPAKANPSKIDSPANKPTQEATSPSLLYVLSS